MIVRMPSRDARTLVLAVLAAMVPASARGQDAVPPLAEEPRVHIPYLDLVTRDVPAYDPPQHARTPRLRMFNMPTGFITNPIGIEEDDDVPGTPDTKAADNDPLSAVQVNVGMYNPNFDLHLPGDPSSLGYYKLYSQLQLVDQGTTSVCLGLQAYTPAGYQFGGLNNGPTVVNPTISWFQELAAGTALQGYVGQSVQANSRWQDNLHGNFQYGMALQYPLPGLKPRQDQGVYLFVQALGRYRYDAAVTDGRTAFWEVLPGLHWRCSNSCWMSLGVSHYNFLTCSWQY